MSLKIQQIMKSDTKKLICIFTIDRIITNIFIFTVFKVLEKSFCVLVNPLKTVETPKWVLLQTVNASNNQMHQNVCHFIKVLTVCFGEALFRDRKLHNLEI